MLLGMAAGQQIYEIFGELDLGQLGRLRAVQVSEGPPCAVSDGQMIKDDYSFVWLADDPLQPVVF